MKSIEYLAAAKEKTGIHSDNAIAKRLGLTRSAIGLVSKGKSGFGNDPAILIAEILGIHPAIVIADCSAERANNEVLKSVWLDISDTFRAAKRGVGLSNLHTSKSPANPHHA
jgi:hypothetical protein